jgi:hypothetical protein
MTNSGLGRVVLGCCAGVCLFGAACSAEDDGAGKAGAGGTGATAGRSNGGRAGGATGGRAGGGNGGTTAAGSAGRAQGGTSGGGGGDGGACDAEIVNGLIRRTLADYCEDHDCPKTLEAARADVVDCGEGQYSEEVTGCGVTVVRLYGEDVGRGFVFDGTSLVGAYSFDNLTETRCDARGELGGVDAPRCPAADSCRLCDQEDGSAGAGPFCDLDGAGGDGGAGGEPSVGGEDPPYSAPKVVELRLGNRHSCAKLSDDSVHCWGKDVVVYPDPDGGFTDSGFVKWPDGPFASSGAEPPADVTDVSYGGGHACGLRPNGTIECWGNDAYGETKAPEGTFQLVAAGADHTCAFGDAVGVKCWGRNDGFQSSPAALVSARNRGYTRVAAGGGGVVCGGVWYETEEEGGASGFDPFPFAATACGLREDGVLDCFGTATKVGVPKKRFLDVAMSAWVTCGITSAGVECWGEDVEGASVAGEFVQVATSSEYTCVIDAGGGLRCWAPLPGDVPLPVPEGTFRRVAVAGTEDYGTKPHFSALRTDGSIVTWMVDPTAGAITRSVNLPGPFKDVSVGHDVTCAVSVEGGVSCWDPYITADVVDMLVVESGDAERVVVGFNQRCVLRTDGSVSCWGGLGKYDTDDFIFVVGEYPGPFTDLSMGSDYACGVLADGGGLRCWGSHVR